MSEYQHYLFDTVNRTLSQENRKAVSALSSHISVSQTSASVEYHYSDFKHDPIDVLERFFDVFTYEANWGDQRLAFRFDSDAVDTDKLREFSISDYITVETRGDSVILDCWLTENYIVHSFTEEDEYYYEDHRVSTSPYVAFHTEITEGDFRSIYLLWLRMVEMEYMEASVSLPVPDGLNQLKEVHRSLIHFIGLSESLLKACSNYRKKLSTKPKAGLTLQEHLPKLSLQEKDSFLEDFLTDNPVSVRSKLRKKLSAFASPEKASTASKSSKPITASVLLEEAEEISRRKAQAIQQAEEERKQHYLNTLEENKERMWNAVPHMIGEKKTKSYMNAALTLQALKYLADNKGTTEDYFRRANAIVSTYPKLTGMRSRMETAGLISLTKQNNRISGHWETERWMKDNPPEKEYPFSLLLT